MEKESTENRAESDPIDNRMILAKQLENSSVALYVFTSSLLFVFTSHFSFKASSK